MVTISRAVEDILNKQIFLQEAINHGIVSFNRLAESIRPEVEAELGKRIKTSAIVMSLRRYSEKLETKQNLATFDYFRETLLKTDVCYIVVEQSTTALDLIQSFYHEVDFKRGGVYNIIQGNYEIGIITNQRHKEKLLNLLSDEKILYTLENLVVISLTYSKDFLLEPGVLYNVLRFIAWQNINIVGIIMTQKELSLVVSRDDTINCYNVLDRLVKHSKSHNQV